MNASTDKSAAAASSWNWTRIGLLGSAVVLAAAVASALLNKEGAAPTTPFTPPPPLAGNPAPPAEPTTPVALPAAVMDADFSLLDGKARKLSDYKGKVLIVDLWATWCGPCRQEIPHLIELANNYKSQGVEVIGLTNENPQTDGPKVKEFAKQFKINYPIGWADPRLAGGIMNGRNGIPQTLIIGRDGKVRKHFVGFSAMISVPQMKAALEEAVNAG